MKCFATIALLACVSLARAEPPVPQNQYLPPNQGGQQPSSQYLPPTQSYQSPSSNYLPPQRHSGGGAGSPPSSSYGAPAAGAPPSSQYGAPAAPSSQYGAPALTGAFFPNKQQGGNGGYGSGSGNGYGGEEQYGPAKYEFKYDVQDYESGNDFGHMEQRDGDLAIGRYYVLLPDGRKQIVDYEADSQGYRPTIRYEQVNNGYNNGNGGGAAGGRGGQGGSGFAGYQ